MFYWSIQKSIVLLTILIFFFCSFFNCKKDNSPLTNHSNEPDTTSHEFQWEYEIIESPYGGGLLYDVAISNENDIWAVGEIYADSDQPWLPYNAVHWDGQQWELKRIPYNGSPWPIRSIWSFSSEDIWFDAFVRWDGSKFIEMSIPNVLVGFKINKIWGSLDGGLYVVGNQGNIAYSPDHGQNWQKLESGTTLDIWDIWGANNPETGGEEILAVASLKNYGRAVDLLRIIGTEVIQIDTSGLHVNQSSVWFDPGKVYYITGNGVFTKRTLSDKSWLLLSNQPLLYKDSMRGIAWNDLFVVGTSGLISHFNGSTWYHYINGEVPSFYGSYMSVAVKGDLVVAVGDINLDQVIILKGMRKR